VSKRFRQTRAFAITMVILINIALNVIFNVVGLISTNTLGKYTATGNAVLVAILMLFAVWAWWYGEDRDRRAELKDAQRRPSGDSG
jgi:amino acid transporter